MTAPAIGANSKLVLAVEATYGVTPVTPTGNQVGFNKSGFKGTQALIENPQLSGDPNLRDMIFGKIDANGPFSSHFNIKDGPYFGKMALGSIASVLTSQVAASGALTPVAAGNVDNGTHSYKYVITRPNGLAGSLVSNTVTVADKTVSGKITVTRSGSLPTGWTWALYRSAAGNAVTGPWVAVPAAGALSATTTSFVDNVADASLSGAFPSLTDSDYVHTCKILTGQLPSYIGEEQITFADGSFEYILVNGLMCDQAKIAVKCDGYVDFDATCMASKTSASNASVFTSPVDWTAAQAFENLMAASTNVQLGTMGSPAAFDGLVDVTVTINNQLNKGDYRVGGAGARASATRARAKVEVQLKAMFTDLTFYNMLTTTPIELYIKWSLPTGEYMIMRVPRLFLEKTDPGIDSEGPLMLDVKGTGAFDATTNTSFLLIFGNDQPTAAYTG